MVRLGVTSFLLGGGRGTFFGLFIFVLLQFNDQEFVLLLQLLVLVVLPLGTLQIGAAAGQSE